MLSRQNERLQQSNADLRTSVESLRTNVESLEKELQFWNEELQKHETKMAETSKRVALLTELSTMPRDELLPLLDALTEMMDEEWETQEMREAWKAWWGF